MEGKEMKAYRYVYDKVVIDGKEYIHTIPRLEVYDNNFVSSLINFRESIKSFGEFVGRL